MLAQSDSGSYLRDLTAVPNFPYHLYSPQPVAHSAKPLNPTPNDAPRLILLCTWTDASPKHILKYVNGYRILYPSSPILLVQTCSADFFSSASALSRKAELLVRMILQELQSEHSITEARGILAHALSNGGSGHLTCLARRYHSVTGLPLPIDALILDSTPTRPTFQALLTSLTMPLPSTFWIRQPLRVLISIGIFFAYLLPRWIGMSNLGDRTYHDLYALHDAGKGGDKDAQEWISKEAVRTYIYSDVDVICSAADIEGHFQTAKGRGFCVTAELWEGSDHVAHMKFDPERYWRVVNETWEQRA
ncbi:hypothetical protein B0J13DRAFT_577002 [Dactylonectria estremocensis]|uniref:Indole-diterpene biosynthesis protein PaxU n=1 Tax=Dactylonectria estremocensis TaxID=1079267 RepID=A0A9P9D1Z3_9HYPO|nr:hypothetical protein B0J13DRAFT_577002 [Dactylonectria estremocensis]